MAKRRRSKKATIGRSQLLKPKRNKTEYANDNTYLKQVYIKNKDLLIEKGFTYDMFKENIKSIKSEEKMGTVKAIEAFGRTRTFMTRSEIALESIKENATKEIITDLRKRGGEWKKGVVWDDYNWNSTEKRFEHKSGEFGIRFVETDDSLTESFVEVINL